MTSQDDIRGRPAYTVAEAARYLKVAPATLRSWVVGRPYRTGAGIIRSQRLIRPAQNTPPSLSFWNLIEAYVLSALRVDHKVKMDAVRRAIRYAESQLHIDRLLLSQELRTDAGRLLLERYGKAIDLSASGQMAMRHTFDVYLKRVEWDEWKFPVRLFPLGSVEEMASQKTIAIDANVAFGRPVLAKNGISTSAIVDRMDAGETVDELAEDYEISPDEVMQAVYYERAA